MKLWLLKAIEDLPDHDDPWLPEYDKTFTFVIRAESELEAREMADNKTCDELYSRNSHTNNPWLNRMYTTCVELTAEGEKGLILREFNHA